jgi:murein DD-endopeptidase MepM/ murein hydrolase activator NlpD
MSRRRAVIVLASAVVAGGSAGAPAGWAPGPPAARDAYASPAEVRSARAAADSLSARLGELERRMGLPSAEADDGATLRLRSRYERLRARESAVAAMAQAWLRFVPSGAPVVGGVITSAFSPGRYHPIRHRVLPHVGLDIGAPFGSPVCATADGTVYATADNPTYGLTVDLEHGSSAFMTRYAHLSRIGVRPGQRVERGQIIGWVGSTGLSTGTHLHYEVFFRGWRRDPISFLPPGPVAEQALSGTDG